MSADTEVLPSCAISFSRALCSDPWTETSRCRCARISASSSRIASLMDQRSPLADALGDIG